MTTLSNKPRYTEEDGVAVVLLLHEYGFQNCELIGSLSREGVSNNDIDIYIPNGSLADKEVLKNILMTSGVVEETDWGGIFFTDTQFGNVDIFFDKSEFDY